MIAKKLSDSEKNEVIELYRQLGETTSTLAGRYSVSTSTISRILKSTLPADEYEGLIQQKRQALRSNEYLPLLQAPAAEQQELNVQPSDLINPINLTATEPEMEPSAPSVLPETVSPETVQGRSDDIPSTVNLAIVDSIELPRIEPVEPSLAVKPLDSKSGPILKRRSQKPLPNEDDSELDLPIAKVSLPEVATKTNVGKRVESESEVLKEILAEEILNLDEDDDLDDDDLEDDDLDDDDFEDEISKPLFATSKLADGAIIQILPLAEALIPRTCYLVIDRASELIAPLLQDFGDLGQIPEEETQNKILPVFDNHRIAKRYSNPRTQRVIKLPDGRILQKTYSHLKAKGISRLLIDGRVYDLTGSDE
jgi:transposase-like protein